jgi:hypothetical protein
LYLLQERKLDPGTVEIAMSALRQKMNSMFKENEHETQHLHHVDTECGAPGNGVRESVTSLKLRGKNLAPTLHKHEFATNTPNLLFADNNYASMCSDSVERSRSHLEIHAHIDCERTGARRQI